MTIRMEYRSATGSELALLGRPLLSPGLYGALVAVGTYLLYWFLAFAVLMTIGALAPLFESRAATVNSVMTGQWAAWKEALLVTLLWGPVFVLPGLVAGRRYRRAKASRWAVWTDRRQRRIEVVEFDGEPYTMVECGKAGRFHIFSMGDGEMLGLSEYNYALTMRTEQVLDELEDYAGQWSESDFEAELTKRLPGFPSTHFQAHRWPHVGTIVDIRTMGERQEPEKVVMY